MQNDYFFRSAIDLMRSHLLEERTADAIDTFTQSQVLFALMPSRVQVSGREGLAFQIRSNNATGTPVTTISSVWSFESFKESNTRGSVCQRTPFA